MTEIRVLLPAWLPLPNANKKVHWATRWRQQQDIKKKTLEIVQLMRVKPMERCEITVIVHPSTSTKRFDPPNWSDAAKPAIDALVLARVIPDDSSAYVPRVSYIAGDPVPGWRLELVLTPLPATPATT